MSPGARSSLSLFAIGLGVACAAVYPPYPVRGPAPASAAERRVADAARLFVESPADPRIVAAVQARVVDVEGGALSATFALDRRAILALDAQASEAEARLRRRYGRDAAGREPRGDRR